MYKLGQQAALTVLGLIKMAAVPPWFKLLRHAPSAIAALPKAERMLREAGRAARPHVLKALEGRAGEYLTRIPVQATMGGIGGLGTGLIMGAEHPGEQAAWGGLMGAGTGLAVAGAPTVRSALIKALRRGR